MIETVTNLLGVVILTFIYGIGLVWSVAATINSVREGLKDPINFLMFVMFGVMTVLFSTALYHL